jgi:DNA-binding winged helix-turn-helix (wHTH) protein/Tol biopolymer transport system component
MKSDLSWAGKTEPPVERANCRSILAPFGIWSDGLLRSGNLGYTFAQDRLSRLPLPASFARSTVSTRSLGVLSNFWEISGKIIAERKDRQMKHFYEFGPFRFEPEERTLLREGSPVPLSPKLIDTLDVLVKNAGHLVEKDELLRRLWPDTFVEEGNLNKNIFLLRQALGQWDGKREYIETIPKRGYRFVASVDRVRETDTQATPREPSFAGRAAAVRTRRLWILWAVVSVLAVAAGFGVYYLLRPSAPRSLHFSVPLRTAMRDLAISHDGRMLAFVSPLPKDGGSALWLHEIGGSGARVLENTEGASYPFWSPEDGFIAFFADGKLKKIRVAGGAVQVICDAPIGRGGTWNRNDVIVFAADSGMGMRRVSAAGGHAAMLPGFEQRVATTKSNRWPSFLPDGNHFLYTSVDFGADLRSEANAVYIGSLDSPEHWRLVSSNANSAYIPSGYLLFSRAGTLMAQRFEAARLRLTGEAFAITNEVEYLSSVARALFSVSENGTLVFQSGAGATFSQLAWFDREGKQTGLLGTRARYANPRLSPDGMRVAVDIDDIASSNTDIWLVEAKRQIPFRLTFDPGQDEAPLWSHDGRRIMWLSDRGEKNGFYLKSSAGSATENSLTDSAGVNLSFASAPSDWSPNGRFVLYTDLQEGDGLHLWVLPMSGNRKPFRLLPGASADVEGQFSPDGHWVTYSSNESGVWQVYVAPFPGPGAKYQISTDGGQQPRWRRDGKELFFLSRNRELMAASVKTGATFQFSSPIGLFATHAHEPLTAEEFFTYDVSADGQRFLVNVNAEESNPPPVDITLNWASGLTK